jgi:putative ABC transport system permease protein
MEVPFTEQDSGKSLSVAIINQSCARRFFPNANPLGQQLTLNGFEGNHKREIVGVVGDVRQVRLAEAPPPQVYVPYTQSPIPFWGGMNVVLRAPLKPEALAGAIEKQINALNIDIPVEHTQPMETSVAASGAESRFDALLFGIFAAIAVVLAAIGIYGVVSYSVVQSTDEIGIRIALGAQKNAILKHVVARGIALAGTGVTIGIVPALGLTRLLSSLLFGITSTDPLTFFAASAALLGIAVLACYIPAQRAASLEPMTALRNE